MTIRPSIAEFKNMDDTSRNLLMWQGLTDTWKKLEETIEHQKGIEAETRVHQRLLISGDGEPALMERVRNLERLAGRVEKISNAVLLQTIGFVFTMVGLAIAFFVRVYPILERIANSP